ncbi:hypothetical protein SAMN02745133_03006 [Desulforamulus putei DSM 12395]|uniref:Uncharacterized protein n=1 Tax=Desulforamulus putei DSM 12395 TaxID=1121429 RepID=A0A1M5CRG2_9FIRM|nr:hypothetical protein [Desulforamulus putei]SHF57227.1 hypothetical protein SAMN02745133_03006 [Desulforamulus putei DSM 12395]
MLIKQKNITTSQPKSSMIVGETTEITMKFLQNILESQIHDKDQQVVVEPKGELIRLITLECKKED